MTIWKDEVYKRKHGHTMAHHGTPASAMILRLGQEQKQKSKVKRRRLRSMSESKEVPVGNIKK